jgi:hypothetical protein
MFDKRTIFPLILIVLGTLTLFGQNVTNLFRLYQETLITIVGLFVSIITILILIYKKYKNKMYIFFKNFEIKITSLSSTLTIRIHVCSLFSNWK